MATSKPNQTPPHFPKPDPIPTILEENDDESHCLLEQPEGRGCFPSLLSPCLGSTRAGGAAAASWAAKRASSLRELSEAVAGPKWKNLARRVGEYLTKKKKRKGIQLYGPFDYALNFDDGCLKDEELERLARGFSVRFAPPVSLSSSGF